MQIGRFVDGKMVERWGSSDELGILKQIGPSRVDGGSAKASPGRGTSSRT